MKRRAKGEILRSQKKMPIKPFIVILLNQAQHCLENSIMHRSGWMKLIYIVLNATENDKTSKGFPTYMWNEHC